MYIHVLMDAILFRVFRWASRKELKQRFPKKLWIDVFSKQDLLVEELDAADDARRFVYAY